MLGVPVYFFVLALAFSLFRFRFLGPRGSAHSSERVRIRNRLAVSRSVAHLVTGA